jgi:diaminopimelate epimerase
VAWAARRREGEPTPGESTWQVDVPGGTVHVTETAAGAMLLTGPADLVARGTILLPG